MTPSVEAQKGKTMKKRSAFLVLVILFLAPAVLSAQAAGRYPQIARAMAKDGYAGRQNAAVARIKKESMDLNRRGYALYEKKEYPGAADLFRQALVADDGNVFARYNLACALSLAWGDKDPLQTPFRSRPALGKTVARLLAEAAAVDVHWLYKIFLDPDLDSLRSDLFSYEDWIPCPGDCCPDQWYTYRPNGTVRYGAGPTDLSGLPGHESRPTAEAEGWYAVIGDYVFVHVPGKNEILKSQWPGGYPAEESGDATRAALDIFQIKRDGGTGMRLDGQIDLYEAEQGQ
jgi:hypothetical protein